MDGNAVVNVDMNVYVTVDVNGYLYVNAYADMDVYIDINKQDVISAAVMWTCLCVCLLFVFFFFYLRYVDQCCITLVRMWVCMSMGLRMLM